MMGRSMVLCSIGGNNGMYKDNGSGRNRDQHFDRIGEALANGTACATFRPSLATGRGAIEIYTHDSTKALGSIHIHLDGLDL